MKADFWWAITYVIAGMSIMIFFAEKIRRITGTRDWRFVNQNFTEEQKQAVKKYLRRMRFYIFGLFLLYIVFALLFIKPK